MLDRSRDFSGLLCTTLYPLMSKSCLNRFVYGSYQFKCHKSISDVRIIGSRTSPYSNPNCSSSDMHCVAPVLLPPLCVVSAPSLIAPHEPRLAITSCLIWGLSSGEVLSPSALLGMLSGAMTMALGFSASLFKECIIYFGNWKCNVFTPCTAQLMASFVTFLSVVYAAVTVQINRLHFFNIAFTRLGCVMCKSVNRGCLTALLSSVEPLLISLDTGAKTGVEAVSWVCFLLEEK